MADLPPGPWLTPIGRRVLGVDVGQWPCGVRDRDIRRGLGYPDGSVAVVYASHVLEHLHRSEAMGGRGAGICVEAHR